MARREHVGTGLGSAAHCATVLLARGDTWVGPETEELNGTSLLTLACPLQSSLSGCLWATPPFLLASYLNV